ncbi:MAG TPA: hypothetical protein VM327_01665 [Candidatus Thermoplasmatota archaeon]|nr:hypothetical protein [Candidatus Thermoplasmatota archaeon]
MAVRQDSGNVSGIVRWFLQPRSFARGWAIVLAGLVVLGIPLELMGNAALLPGFLEFDWTHDLLHVVLLGLAIHFGWFAAPPGTQVYARIFGIGGLLVGATGFTPPLAGSVHHLVGWHFEVGEDLVHTALGLWGSVAGFRRSLHATALGLEPHSVVKAH